MTDFSKNFNLDFRQETMDIIQMRKYVDLEIFKQGSASAKVLAPLFTAIIDKLASISVIVPVVVPFIRMLAPIMGSPLTSVTVPVTVLDCC